MEPTLECEVCHHPAARREAVCGHVADLCHDCALFSCAPCDSSDATEEEDKLLPLEECEVCGDELRDDQEKFCCGMCEEVGERENLQ